MNLELLYEDRVTKKGLRRARIWYRWQVFRMICRYNRYVLRFGRIKDDGEIARRERLWEEAVGGLEFELGRPPAALGPEEFARELEARLDLVRFRPRPAAEA